VYMRVVRVPGQAVRARAGTDGGRLVAAGLLALWLGLGAAVGVGVPVALAGALGPRMVAAAMTALVPDALVVGAALSVAAYLVLLTEGNGPGQVGRHAAAVGAVAALVCRAVAVPAVVDSAGGTASAHGAAIALFGLSLAAGAVGLIALVAAARGGAGARA